MKIYAHRGNLNGPNPERENNPKYLDEALKAGFCVELDVWFKDGCWFTGHDKPTFIVPLQYLMDSNKLCHAKDLATCKELEKYDYAIHYFYQDEEMAVHTSEGICLLHEKFVEIYTDSFKINQQIYVDLSPTPQFFPSAYGLIVDYPKEITKSGYGKKYPVDLIILDVDGVMTNGCKTYDETHKVISKQYCDRDFTAIKKFQAAEIPVVLISGCSFNENMARIRKIPFRNSRVSGLDKTPIAKEVCNLYKTDFSKTVFVGDDYYDMSLLNQVKFPFCPLDAAEDVKKIAKVLPKAGGCGAVEALYDLFSQNIRKVFPYEN
jgi:YrbI family 3-deoxy-D-manno-octulosonate 8-phosphate phosphatase